MYIFIRQEFLYVTLPHFEFVLLECVYVCMYVYVYMRVCV